MLIRVLLIFCLSISLTIADEAGEKVRHWLENTNMAMKDLDYLGTVAFFKNGRLDTMKYFHSVNEGQQQERLLSLNSPMREVIREAGKVRCVFKKSNEIVLNHRPVSNSFILDLPKDINSIQAVYQLKILADESVAMRQAFVVSIEPKDQYRYARKVWLDKEYFLPLKIEVYDRSGATLEQVVFTEIKVGEKTPDGPIANDVGNAKIKHLHQTKSLSTDQASFVLQNLPLNFDVVFFTRMNSEESKSSAEHLLLSDGFSAVSVYKEAKAVDTEEGPQTLGSVKSYTKVIDNFQITVLGEVPANTVQFIAQGIKLK